MIIVEVVISKNHMYIQTGHKLSKEPVTTCSVLSSHLMIIPFVIPDAQSVCLTKSLLLIALSGLSVFSQNVQ